MDAASKQGEQKVTMRAKSADNRSGARSDKGWAGFAAGEGCLEREKELSCLKQRKGEKGEQGTRCRESTG